MVLQVSVLDIHQSLTILLLYFKEGCNSQSLYTGSSIQFDYQKVLNSIASQFTFINLKVPWELGGQTLFLGLNFVLGLFFIFVIL